MDTPKQTAVQPQIHFYARNIPLEAATTAAAAAAAGAVGAVALESAVPTMAVATVAVGRILQTRR